MGEQSARRQRAIVRQQLCNYCAARIFNGLSRRCTPTTSANDGVSWGCAILLRVAEVVSGLLWPLTRTVLERIAAGYDAEAEREDQSAGTNAHRGARL
jgi:hypothetical protein